jgi:predicted dehydrogenase
VTALRIAVVGVGHLGRHHARILADTPGVRLVSVIDINEARARSVAAELSAEPLFDARALHRGSLDAVTIATPTASHHTVARALVELGIPVLIEKPLTRTVEEADDLIAAAARAGVPLAVGHTERFNPAVTTALPLVASPRFAEVHRLSTFPERSLDIDVVFDLMIHDLDILLAAVGAEVVSIEAVGVPVLTDRVDIANARLRFATGCIANLTASRISREPIRKARFFQPDAYLSIDYVSQEVERYGVERHAGQPPAIVGGRLQVPRQEPLRLELEDFVRAVRTQSPPMVSGEAGRLALGLAQRIVDHMAEAALPRPGTNR